MTKQIGHITPERFIEELRRYQKGSVSRRHFLGVTGLGLIAELGQQDEADWQFAVGVRYAARQVQELIDAGVPGVHFYVLNKSPATAAVLNEVRRP